MRLRLFLVSLVHFACEWRFVSAVCMLGVVVGGCVVGCGCIIVVLDQ